jgi:bifunctional ADP-heptose synthase (sugar kinase/adenylyltransferase)
VLIDRIRPDIHVKSDQYREDELPERSVVLQHGGRILMAPHVAGESTTDTIGRILYAYSLHG